MNKQKSEWVLSWLTHFTNLSDHNSPINKTWIKKYISLSVKPCYSSELKQTFANIMAITVASLLLHGSFLHTPPSPNPLIWCTKIEKQNP
jgi:hypothetical protein